MQLAIQRSAHKWTFEDFAQCFPSYVEEDKNGASATFNSISDYIEAQNFRDLDKLFKDYVIQENIDILHKVINDAKERKAGGETSKDAWRHDLEPRAAVCARTIPVLKAEVKRLRETLKAAEKDNAALLSQLEENSRAADEADTRSLELLAKLDAVYEEWKNLPTEDIEAWTVQTLETLEPSARL